MAIRGMRYEKETYRPPTNDYPIGNEIKRDRFPGSETITALTAIAASILNSHPERRWLFEQPEDGAFAFCFLQDADGTLAGFNPKFVTLYLKAASNDEFKRLARRPMNQWMLNQIASHDYGRLRDLIENHLKAAPYAVQRPLYWLINPQDPEHPVKPKNPNDPNDPDYEAYHRYEAESKKSPSSLLAAAKTVHVDWPSPETVKANHEERARMRYVKEATKGKKNNASAKIKMQSPTRLRIGKNGQLNQWLLTVFTAAEGSLMVSTVTNLVVAECPYIIGDDSANEIFQRRVSLDALQLPAYNDPYDDPTFEEVARAEHRDELIRQAVEAGVDPSEYC